MTCPTERDAHRGVFRARGLGPVGWWYVEAELPLGVGGAPGWGALADENAEVTYYRSEMIALGAARAQSECPATPRTRVARVLPTAHIHAPPAPVVASGPAVVPVVGRTRRTFRARAQAAWAAFWRD